MKQITELKKGDKLYDTGNLQVRSYVYLCVHPTGKGKYHIEPRPREMARKPLTSVFG